MIVKILPIPNNLVGVESFVGFGIFCRLFLFCE